MSAIRWIVCFLIGTFFAVFSASIVEGAGGRFDSGTIIGAVVCFLGSAAFFFASSNNAKARGASALCAAALLGAIALIALRGASSYDKIVSLAPSEMPQSEVLALQSGSASARNMSASYGIVVGCLLVLGFGLIVHRGRGNSPSPQVDSVGRDA